MAITLLYTAYGLFIANFLFGIAVYRRLIDTSRVRFVHHLLYFLVMAALAAPIAVLALAGHWRAAAWPAMMAALLLVMPRFRGRSRGHRIYAVFCLVCYTTLIASVHLTLETPWN